MSFVRQSAVLLGISVMSFAARYLYNTFSRRRPVHVAEGGDRIQDGKQETQENQEDFEQYEPSVEDVFSVKTMLAGSFELPLELVDTIIDHAEYWPHTSVIRKGEDFTIRAGAGHENQFLLRSYPLGYLPKEHDRTRCMMRAESTLNYLTIKPEPWRKSEDFPGGTTEEICKHWVRDAAIRGEYPCRKIVFTIKSHDQGWGGDRRHKGTYNGSYTWFEVGKEKMTAFRDSQLPPFSPSSPAYHENFTEARAGGVLEVLGAFGAKPLPVFEIPDDGQTIPQSENAVPSPVVCTHMQELKNSEKPQQAESSNSQSSPPSIEGGDENRVLSPSNVNIAPLQHTNPRHHPPRHLPQQSANTTSESITNSQFQVPLQERESSNQETTSTPPIICSVRTIAPSTATEGGTEFHHPLLWDMFTCLQKNLTATEEFKEHKIVWSCTDNVDPDSVDGKALDEQGRGRATATGEYVRNMKVGDVVTVWGKARFPGWANFVETVKIDIYWAV